MPDNKDNKINSPLEELEEVQENLNNLWQQVKDMQGLSARPMYSVEEEEKKLKEQMEQASDWKEKIKIAAKIISIKL